MIYKENKSNNMQKGGLHGLCITSQDGSHTTDLISMFGLQDPPYSNKIKPILVLIYFNLDYARQHKIYHMLDYEVETNCL